MLAALTRKLFGQAQTAAASNPPTAESPLLLPGSNGRSFPALVDIVNAFSGDPQHPKVLLFGDSVLERTSKHDGDLRTLAALIQACMVDQDVLSISHSAFNPTMYAALARVVAHRPRRPVLAILPVNLRCFSPQWDLNPAWQFHQELAVIERFLADQRTVVTPIADIRETSDFFTEFDSTPVNYPLSQLSSIGEFRALVRTQPTDDATRLQRSREIFVYHYTHPLRPVHRRLRALREAVMTLTDAGCRVLTYLTPLNHEAGVRLVGEQFRAVLRGNSATVVSALSGLSGLVSDWTEQLPDVSFFHEDLATEHLNERGRVLLATLVVDTALDLLRATTER